MATEEEKKVFLHTAKQLISEGKRDFIKRTYDHPSKIKVKWLEALLDIGLTQVDQVWDEVLLLTINDYDEGPINDYDRPSDGKTIWTFKSYVNDTLTYIKLKIDDRRGCVCLSFHKNW